MGRAVSLAACLQSLLTAEHVRTTSVYGRYENTRIKISVGRWGAGVVGAGGSLATTAGTVCVFLILASLRGDECASLHGEDGALIVYVCFAAAAAHESRAHAISGQVGDACRIGSIAR